MRGIQKQNSTTATSFSSDASIREEITREKFIYEFSERINQIV